MLTRPRPGSPAGYRAIHPMSPACTHASPCCSPDSRTWCPRSPTRCSRPPPAMGSTSSSCGASATGPPSPCPSASARALSASPHSSPPSPAAATTEPTCPSPKGSRGSRRWWPPPRSGRSRRGGSRKQPRERSAGPFERPLVTHPLEVVRDDLDLVPPAVAAPLEHAQDVREGQDPLAEQSAIHGAHRHPLVVRYLDRVDAAGGV